MARKHVSLVSPQQPARGASRVPTPEFRALLEAAQLSPTQLSTIERRYGTRAAAAVQAHPYRLVHDIPGVSFQAADTIARTLGTGKRVPPASTGSGRFRPSLAPGS